MGIRTGDEYVNGLKEARTLYVNGEFVQDVTTYPAFEGIIKTMARLYDSQHSPAYQDATTYVTDAGDRVSKTLLHARTVEEMNARVACDYARNDLTHGLMGRIPDFMNSLVLDSFCSLKLQNRTEEAEKVGAYLDFLRLNDLALTHALVDPQTDRSKSDAPNETIQIVDRSKAGITVRGARMLSTLAPVSDEVIIGPFAPRKPGEERFASYFAAPMTSPGLKIVCRESFDGRRSTFDQPLTTRYEEGDAILIFDDVFIPDERVFIAGDIEAYNNLLWKMPGYMYLQSAARGTSKLRFLTGLAGLIAKVNGRSKSPRHQEEIGELVALVTLAEGITEAVAMNCLRRVDGGSEEPSSTPGYPALAQSQLGSASVNIFYPQSITRAIEVVRMVAGSGVLAITEEDLNHSDIGHLIEKFTHGPADTAETRLRVLKMAWDITGTSFGSRQALYERLYTGDPVINRITWFNREKRTECERFAQRLLDDQTC